MLLENDLRVGGHVREQLALRVGNGYAHLERRDIIQFLAHRGDAFHHALKGFRGEGLDLGPNMLAAIGLANVCLVHFAFDIHAADIAEGHNQRRGAAQIENRGNRIAQFHVAGQHDAGDGRANRGITERLFRSIQGRLGRCHPRASLLHLSAGRLHGGIQQLLAILGHLESAAGVVELLLRSDLLFEQLLSPVEIAPGEFQLGVGRFNLGFGFSRNGRLQIRFLAVASRLGLAHLRLEVLLVQFRQNLAFGYPVPDIHQQRLDDSVRLRFYLHL